MASVLRRDSLVLAFGGQAANALAGYLVAVAVARLVDPAGYGVYAVVYGLLLAIELIVRLGIPVAAARRLSRGGAREWAGMALTTSFVLGGAATVLLLAAAPLLAVFVPTEDGARLIRLAAPDALFYVPLLALFTLAPALGRPRAGSVLLLVYSGLRSVLTAGALLFAPCVEAALLANVAASALTLALGCVVLRLAPCPVEPKRLRVLTADAGSDWLRTVALQLAPLLPLWAVGMLGDPVASSHWAAALSLARLPQLVAIAASPLLLAELARGRGRGGPWPLAPLVVALGGTLALAVEAEPLLVLLFGEPFRPAAPLATLLVLGVGLGITLLQLASIAALARGRRGMSVGAPLTGLMLLAPALALFVPLAGPTGGAWATLFVLLPLGLWSAFAELVRERLAFLAARAVPFGAACTLPASAAGAVASSGPWLLAEGLLVGGILAAAVYGLFRPAS